MGNHKIIKIGSRSVRYSMYDFMAAVREYPLLWERTAEDFHNRERREQVWFQIACKLNESISTATDADKEEIAKTLAKRWKNTRDSFIRNLKNKQSIGDARSYIYEKELNFLLNKEYEPEEPDDSICEKSSKANIIAAFKTCSPHEKPIKKRQTLRSNTAAAAAGKSDSAPAKSSSTTAKKRRISSDSDYSNFSGIDELCDEIHAELSDSNNVEIVNTTAASSDEPILAVKETRHLTNTKPHAIADQNNAENSPFTILYATSLQQQQQQTQPEQRQQQQQPQQHHHMEPKNILCAYSNGNEIDADQAFFDSIKPDIRNWNPEKKLDFRIEILKLIKSFRSK